MRQLVVQGLESHLSPDWLGRDLVSLRLTSHHLLTGHSSGHVSLYRRINSATLEKKISRRVTGRDNITVVSLGPGLVCVGCRTGEVVLLHLAPLSHSVFRVQESVTALAVSRAGQVYVGGERGCVAVYSGRPRAVTRQILDLGASVVQIEVSGDTVVASSTGATVICNTEQKTFRQVGSQQRSGHHGVCLTGGQVWSSRPGARLWLVDIKTGEVLATIKYKPLLQTINCSQIIGSDAATTTASTVEHSFSNLNTDPGGLTVTFSNSGNILYILDLEQREVIAWSPINNILIKEAHIEGDLILILGAGGELLSLRLGTVPELAGHCISARREDLLYELLLSVYQEDGGLTECSPVDLSKLYFLCLHLEPSWKLRELQADLLRMLGTSREALLGLSRSAPAQTSPPLPVAEDINRNIRR